VTEELIGEFIGDPSSCHVFTCGPGLTRWDKKAANEQGEDPQPRFLESTLEALANLGIDKKRISRESYG
jgi:hypothetical protein